MRQRLRVSIRGAVQGVGFRPFVYRLAGELELAGWVCNTSQGLFLEVEGERRSLETFLLRIEKEKPQNSFIQSLESSFLDEIGFTDFAIRESEDGEKNVLILPDIATCQECREEILDPNDRRYLYPFVNCTNCGPRYSIINKLPYDRKNTTMHGFKLCGPCSEEYKDPSNRRFHAQPNACPDCGPKLALWDYRGKVIAASNDALNSAVKGIREGAILALKGLGGFQLIVDARNSHSIKLLRERKHREAKPFAVMYPSIEHVESDCFVSLMERRSLVSSESPIVILKKRKDHKLSEMVAPENPYLGVMLPYTPLHILLMKELDFPIIATSANISQEPICINEKEAFKRLKDIADLFLVNDRPIARHVDDSIVRVIMGQEMVMRRARGFAPLPIMLEGNTKDILAVGPHLKNTVAVSSLNNVFISQHIGDLETERAYTTFKSTIEDLKLMYELDPECIVCDEHPDYFSTKYAKSQKLPVIPVQHHYAHVLSCMAENHLKGPLLGIAWDGTGYGPDGTVWGGEFLTIKDGTFDRAAHFKGFPLPGGETAVKEPRRSAVGLLFSRFGAEFSKMSDVSSLRSFDEQELNNISKMLIKNINSPLTTSVGRLFDAVASILDLCQKMEFEGQAAMLLEFLTEGVETDDHYSFDIGEYSEGCIEIDGPSIREILDDVKKGIKKPVISAKFHNSLVEIAIAITRRVRLEKIVLTGGCFQNKYLAEHAIKRFREEKFRPYWHQRIPPNDGGISLGQVFAVQKKFRK